MSFCLVIKKKSWFSNAGKLLTLGQLKKTTVIIYWKAAGSTETQQELLTQIYLWSIFKHLRMSSSVELLNHIIIKKYFFFIFWSLLCIFFSTSSQAQIGLTGNLVEIEFEQWSSGSDCLNCVTNIHNFCAILK